MLPRGCCSEQSKPATVAPDEQTETGFGLWAMGGKVACRSYNIIIVLNP